MNRSMGMTQLRWLWLSVVVMVLDLASKYWIIHHFDLYETRPLIPFLNMTYAQNTGAAFSFLADSGGWQRWFFILVAVLIIAILMRLMYRSTENKWINAAYALIIGGALGNLCDRIANGFVIDFIDFYVNQWHWPTFNLADSAICIGALFILLEGFLNPASKKQITQKEK
ncbi:signal peptidase II [Candidatus Williamhamiltonella defendens]|uniref:signal peptidase II n=1 Tax=Candidatus Williamhamiltonella defendens TaxID=138072 RepID=UPI0013E0DE73|nr:signal peptidase II [Candidatus Hamiltonella defensa]